MKSILFVLAALGAGLASFYVLDFLRVKSMRALTSRLGFQFTDSPLPASFTMTCYPFDGNLATVWNLIEGQLKGTSVLVFDCTVWGNYRTFIAVQKEGDPFVREGKLSTGWILQSNGWTAVYEYGFGNFLPWTMSVQRIEDYFKNLRI